MIVHKWQMTQVFTKRKWQFVFVTMVAFVDN